MPEKQLEFEAQRAGLESDYLSLCAACAQSKTVETIQSAFDAKSTALDGFLGTAR